MRGGNTTTMNIRIDKELKSEAEALFADMGMNMTTAVTIFIKQSVKQRKIPFEIVANYPNKITQESMEEVEAMIKNPSLITKKYSSFGELTDEVLGDA